MLRLAVPEVEVFDDEEEVFYSFEAVNLELEHSLVSLSKWESVWEKPFLSKNEKTDEETYSYISAMLLSPEEFDLERLDWNHIEQINKYINAKMTATWFSDRSKKKTPDQIITSEIIYYWMISFNIPFECQFWHLNRLLTLIEVCNRKNAPQKKMSKSALLAQNRDLNAARRAQLGTRG